MSQATSEEEFTLGVVRGKNIYQIYKENFGAEVVALINELRSGTKKVSVSDTLASRLKISGIHEWLSCIPESKERDISVSKKVILAFAKSIVQEENDKNMQFSDEQLIQRMWEKCRFTKAGVEIEGRHYEGKIALGLKSQMIN